MSPDQNTLTRPVIDCAIPDETDNAPQNNAYARIIDKMARQHRLLSVHWELTYRCNETCTHCYLNVLPPNAQVPDELTLDEAKHTIDQIVDMGALNLTFSGGEILVRRDFFEIAEYARRKQLAVRLMTNGILITPRLADRIAALHPTGVELSVYGADAATHEAITQRPRSFEITLRAIRLLRERGVHTIMKTPLMCGNARQLHALRALAESMDVVFRYDPTITAKDNGDESPLKHRLTHDDLVWLFREGIAPDATPPASIDGNHRSCSIGLHSMVIDPYGNVFPCIQARLSAGNLRMQSLREIWERSPVFSDVHHLTFSELPICSSCELNPICRRCHATAFTESGNLRAPSAMNCRESLARRQAYIEKGILPSDFPIPAHLKNGVFDKSLVQNIRLSFPPVPI